MVWFDHWVSFGAKSRSSKEWIDGRQLQFLFGKWRYLQAPFQMLQIGNFRRLLGRHLALGYLCRCQTGVFIAEARIRLKRPSGHLNCHHQAGPKTIVIDRQRQNYLVVKGQIEVIESSKWGAGLFGAALRADVVLAAAATQKTFPRRFRLTLIWRFYRALRPPLTISINHASEEISFDKKRIK